MSSPSFWTAEREQYLRDNWLILDRAEIAAHLRKTSSEPVTPYAVGAKALRMNLARKSTTLRGMAGYTAEDSNTRDAPWNPALHGRGMAFAMRVTP